ncbi:hypothetical protein P7K49_020824 [Saguinus oedipus]|uniref:Uncharacterized protein n=1 Tax=Saguinus oedipus TaxID=9490 RepID=A0ABQ9UQW8_SAGOE|nr:hypothetical protein P7K49_020824 [Saguinus oedipus]
MTVETCLRREQKLDKGGCEIACSIVEPAFPSLSTLHKPSSIQPSLKSFNSKLCMWAYWGCVSGVQKSVGNSLWGEARSYSGLELVFYAFSSCGSHNSAQNAVCSESDKDLTVSKKVRENGNALATCPFIDDVNFLICARNGAGPRDEQNKDKHGPLEANRFRKSAL